MFTHETGVVIIQILDGYLFMPLNTIELCSLLISTVLAAVQKTVLAPTANSDRPSDRDNLWSMTETSVD